MSVNNTQRSMLANYVLGQGSSSTQGKNYVKNSFGMNDTTNVSASGAATVAKNTTTPLTGISDFLVTLPNNTTDYVEWSLDTLDNSLTNQNCQLTFDYKVGSLGSAVQAQVLINGVLTGSQVISATPSQFQLSLNVLCGDLTTATTVRISNASGNSGTSSINIANVNYGKATNIGNVAKDMTVTQLTTGSGTYTVPAGVTSIKVKMVGGGGGGGGANNNTRATTGGTTSFGTSLLTATGGTGGAGGTGLATSTGGTCTISSPAVTIVSAGGSGGGGGSAGDTFNCSGGDGGASPFGGNGGSAQGSVGVAAAANTGSGGGGAGAGSGNGGTGGASGGYCEAIINNPSLTYSYSIASGGAGAGSGAAGAAGVVIIEESYGLQQAVTPNQQKAPTIQTLTSGTTYTRPNGVTFLKVRMVGAGGGGAGGAQNSFGGAGGAGGATTFSTFLTANGGSGGSTHVGGSGGTATISSPAYGTALSGGSGGGGTSATINVTPFPAGGTGASSPFGGAGGSRQQGVGFSAIANSGSGGGGGAITNTVNGGSGAGGGAGGFIEAIITNPSLTYTYAIGTGGTAGTAGTSGFAGGTGGSGYIEVTEYYSQTAPILTGSVTSNSSGAERIERAYITKSGACTIITQSGSWLTSATANGTGRCDLVWPSSTFSAAPSCITTNAGTGSRIASTNPTSTTGVSVFMTNPTSLEDNNFNIICIGQR